MKMGLYAFAALAGLSTGCFLSAGGSDFGNEPISVHSQSDLPAGSPGRSQQSFPSLVPFTSADGSMKIFVPAGWKSSEKNLSSGHEVLLSDPSGRAELEFVCFYEKPVGVTDAVGLATASLRNALRTFPELKLLCAFSSPDRQRTVTESQCNYRQGLWKGRTYYSMAGNGACIMMGLRTPVSDFARLQPLLLSTLSNFRLAGVPLTWQTDLNRPLTFQTRLEQSPDGSCSAQVPAGWKFQARQGTCSCSSQDDSVGFAFFAAVLIGPSRIPHFDSSIVPGIHLTYRPPLDALVAFMRAIGNGSDYVILDRNECTARAQESTLKLKRACQWENGLLSFKSKHGVDSLVLADVLGMAPLLSGQWGFNAMVVWCPRGQFSRTYPELIRLAQSFSINEQFAANYIRAGMENLQRLMRETAAHNSRIQKEILEDQRQWNQELSRRREYSWYQLDQYVRGEQSFVRDTSGLVFTTDSSGLSASDGSGSSTRIAEGKPFDYPNFEGEKWGLTPVNYEIWKQIQH